MTTTTAKTTSTTTQISRSGILKLAWPIILANASVPLLGLVDTAVIGNFGSLAGLGAIAFGAVIFSFVYWGFGFLRMGTTGFVAQAAGAGDEQEVRAALWRALLLALVLGVLLLVLQSFILAVSLFLLNGSDQVEALTTDYFRIRIWGAPAALGLFALMGTLVGLGRSKSLLLVQLVLNGLNMLLDIWFVAFMDWGVAGIALGTVLAEWISVVLAMGLVLRLLLQTRDAGGLAITLFPRARVLHPGRFRQMLTANADIMIRTLLLVFSFAWFIALSADFGDEVLAATHILLQLISFSAFFLDGFAYVAEALVGRACGSKNLAAFDQAVWRSTELAAVSAAGLAVLIVLGGSWAVAQLTAFAAVRTAAQAMLPLAALYVLLSFAAFQLDGIFIGATRTRQMRNAAVVSSLLFLLLSLPLTAWWASSGLWLAFIAYLCLRAVALAWHYPVLRTSVGAS
ncbi:MAG: MATE family efflux transporter [Pseudomonadales bacterium]|nr:MATE family efflux transporter [Pseudomonadales bacterium]